MGGKGSGRLNKTDAFLKRNSDPFKSVGNVASVGDEVLVLPNNSGMEDYSRKRAIFWSQLEAQTGLTGDKSGDFNLTTTKTITAEQLTSTDTISMDGSIFTIGDGSSNLLTIRFNHVNLGNLSYNTTTSNFLLDRNLVVGDDLTVNKDITMLGHLMTLGNGTIAPIIKFDGFESDGEITYNPVTGLFGFDSPISVAGNATINGDIVGTGDIDRTGEIKLITIPNDARFETINNSMEFEKANGGSWIMRFENSGAGGTLSNPVGCDNDQSIMNFQGRSTTGTAGGYRTVCRVQCRATEDHDFNASALGTKMQFFTTPKQVAFDINAMTLEDTGDLTLLKKSGIGIKVDIAAPTFGFRDILGDQFTKNTGATKPTLTQYNGAIQAWQFAAGKEAFFTYHIPHDYVAGTPIFLHVHWSHTATTVTGGNVTFKATSILAKAHNQQAFQSTPSVGTFTGTASTTQYQQILSEVLYSDETPTGLEIDTANLEPDSVIELTFEVDANNITVSGGGVPDPFIHFVDIHYQSTNIATKDKAPDFYT